jgi:hypothetical protein
MRLTLNWCKPLTRLATRHRTGTWQSGHWSIDRTWPEQAADGFTFAWESCTQIPVQDPNKAIQAFKAGLAAVPNEQQYQLRQVPFESQIESRP